VLAKGLHLKTTTHKGDKIMADNNKDNLNKGFASMDKEEQREINKSGQVAHKNELNQKPQQAGYKKDEEYTRTPGNQSSRPSDSNQDRRDNQ